MWWCSAPRQVVANAFILLRWGTCEPRSEQISKIRYAGFATNEYASFSRSTSQKRCCYAHRPLGLSSVEALTWLDFYTTDGHTAQDYRVSDDSHRPKGATVSVR